jgi:hypothetical protein
MTTSLIGAFVDDNPGEAGRKPLPVSRQRQGGESSGHNTESFESVLPNHSGSVLGSDNVPEILFASVKYAYLLYALQYIRGGGDATEINHSL